jgi:GTP cyclohydrolase I
MNEITEPQAREAVRVLLGYIGEDPDRDGLLDTPKRVAKALREMTEGYREDPKAILSTNFDVPFDQMVTLKDIPFVSMCEHHMLPFEGKASVAYIPNGRVVGLSKLARVVDTFAKRLQVQERLTQEIAEAIDTHVGALGVGVIVKSRHTCMCYRGIKKNGTMVTSVTLGLMRTDLAARTEFLTLTGE